MKMMDAAAAFHFL